MYYKYVLNCVTFCYITTSNSQGMLRGEGTKFITNKVKCTNGMKYEFEIQVPSFIKGAFVGQVKMSNMLGFVLLGYIHCIRFAEVVLRMRGSTVKTCLLLCTVM